MSGVAKRLEVYMADYGTSSCSLVDTLFSCTTLPSQSLLWYNTIRLCCDVVISRFRPLCTGISACVNYTKVNTWVQSVLKEINARASIQENMVHLASTLLCWQWLLLCVWLSGECHSHGYWLGWCSVECTAVWGSRDPRLPQSQSTTTPQGPWHTLWWQNKNKAVYDEASSNENTLVSLYDIYVK